MIDTDLPIYPIFIFISLVANIIIILITYKKFNFTLKETVCLLLYENAGIIIGAKLLNFFQNYDKYNGEFNFLETGISSYGAIIGALIFFLLFAVQFKKNLKDIVSLFIPSIPLMYSISKLSCLVTGCCYGIRYNGIGSIRYLYSHEAPYNVNLFPVQLVESITFFLIFLYIFNIAMKNKFNQKYIAITIILCSTTKFILDFFRSSDYNTLISSNKIIGVFFFIIGLFLYINHEKKQK